jgi:beta-aspartyl-dipeptidase (metallo-type)
MHLLLNADVYGPEKMGIRHLLVAGEKVVWIGEEEPVLPDSFGVERTDLDGRRLIPGLVDCHVHLTGGGGEGGFATSVPPLPLSRFTRGGTTTVVGVLGTDDMIRTTAQLVARARALTAEGITAYCLTGGYHVPPMTLTGTIQGDIVQVDPIIGVGEFAISDHRSSQPTLEELLRIASEARVGGMLAGKAGLVHLHLGDGERGLDLVRQALAETELPAKCFHPTHVNRRKELFEEALALAKPGVPIDVTAFPPPDERADEIEAVEAIVAYLEADLPSDGLTVSSDGGGSFPCFDPAGRASAMGVGAPEALANALTACLAAGIALQDALPAFTRNVADLYRLRAKGRVRVRGDADLVVLDEKGRPRDVMARGQWHVREGRVEIRGTFEAP